MGAGQNRRAAAHRIDRTNTKPSRAANPGRKGDKAMRKETLPTGRYEGGKWVLNDAYTPNWENEFITCAPYGEMQDGTLVWADKYGKQYTRQKIWGRFFFIEL